MAVDRPTQSMLAAEQFRAHSFADAAAAAPMDDNDGGWLVSFVDILMLLLTLFVLLLAMSQMHGHRSAPPVTAARHTPHSAPHREAPAKPTAAPAQERTAAARPATANRPANANPAPAEPTVPAAPVPQLLIAKAAVPDLPPLVVAAVTAPEAQPVAGKVPAPAEPSPAGKPAEAAARAPAATSAASRTVAQQTPAPAKTASVVPAAPAAAKTAFSVPAAIRNQVEVVASANKVNLVVKDDVLFAPGSARLRASGRTVLSHIADLLGRDSYPVSVQGYTDDTPIHTDRFPSNWELSTARATVVTRFLIGHGIASNRLSAVGYGATRPRASNATAAGRARNRRVSLVVHLHRPTGTETSAPTHR